MFGRSWKLNRDDSTVIDDDTMPADSTIMATFDCYQAQILSEIAHDIANSDSESVVCYHDDGSRRQGAGAYVVNGVTIDGKFRPLQTFNIAAETRENLADLKVTVMKLLSAVSGIDAKILYEKMDFYMSDSASHNLFVMDIVSEELGSSHKPEQLICNMHPVLMFCRVLSNTWKDIEISIGRDKIFANFLGHGGTSSSTYPSVTTQALDCMMRIISRDFNDRSWNYASDFSHFISPARNFAVRLRQERFECLGFACAVGVHHFEDAARFLDDHSTTNQLACLNRQFLSLEFLQIMYCLGALIGIHLIQPYVSFVFCTDTQYPDLEQAFVKLDQAFKTVDPTAFLRLDAPALDFVPIEHFTAKKFRAEICASVEACAAANREEVVQLLAILIPRLQSGFSKQRSEWFGFDEHTRGTSILARYNQEKLKKAPIHNIKSEQSVALANFELSRRGPNHLAAASRAIVCGKNADLLDRQPPEKFREFASLVGQGGKVPEIIGEFKAKQTELENASLAAKTNATASLERRRFKDLAALQSFGGPFVSSADVDRYVADPEISAKEKQDRLYKEVRFARDSSMSIPRNYDIFKLRKKYRPLPYEEYACNLKIYLDNVSTNASVTMDDFSRALAALSQ